MQTNMYFKEGFVKDNNNMFDDLRNILDSVDADFTGINGEEYYIDGCSGFNKALNDVYEIECEQERIEHVIEECFKYSGGYYLDFKYSIIPVDDGWHIVIATMN